MIGVINQIVPGTYYVLDNYILSELMDLVSVALPAIRKRFWLLFSFELLTGSTSAYLFAILF